MACLSSRHRAIDIGNSYPKRKNRRIAWHDCMDCQIDAYIHHIHFMISTLKCSCSQLLLMFVVMVQKVRGIYARGWKENIGMAFGSFKWAILRTFTFVFLLFVSNSFHLSCFCAEYGHGSSQIHSNLWVTGHPSLPCISISFKNTKDIE